MLGSNRFTPRASAMRPFIVASDLHLSPTSSGRTAHALTDLVRSNPDHEVILAGDVFNLSWEAAGRSAAEAIGALLEKSPELKAALRAHISAGSPLTLLAGNHDAGLMAPELRTAMLTLLELAADSPLEVASWF